jgi:hypothetical protein
MLPELSVLGSLSSGAGLYLAAGWEYLHRENWQTLQRRAPTSPVCLSACHYTVSYYFSPIGFLGVPFSSTLLVCYFTLHLVIQFKPQALCEVLHDVLELQVQGKNNKIKTKSDFSSNSGPMLSVLFQNGPITLFRAIKSSSSVKWPTAQTGLGVNQIGA